MDSLLSPFQGPPGGQVKLAATVQLAMCIIASVWQPDVSAAFAVLGVLSIVHSNLELLQLFLYLNPATILLNVVQLLEKSSSWWTLFQILEILVKVGGTYFAYNVYQNEVAGGEQGYQAFGNSPSRDARHDPFQAYQPPQTQQPTAQPAAQQQTSQAHPPPAPPPPPPPPQLHS